jgi:FKBP-type peptidyl-prolyl cis-trans isomerase FkpA
MRLAILLLLVGICACDSPTGVDERWANPESIQYAASLGIDLSKMNKNPSGLYWQDIVIGDADTASIGDNVRVHYTGWLPDGTQFDTTIGRSPIEFLLGLGFVRKGFDEGIIGMRVGGVRRLVIRPELAFGVRGSPDNGVPPSTTIIMRVERLTTPAH